MTEELQWQQVVHRDPYLAGSIACCEWDWWDGTTAESQAESVGLLGEQREKFLQGWNAELAEQEQQRKEQMFKEWDEIGQTAFEKGDPAQW